MFLAATAKLGLPFLLGQDLLYLLASAAMVLALAPVVASRTARVLLFALCVFNPATLSSDPTVFGVGGTVLTRELLYASLTLLVIAAARSPSGPTGSGAGACASRGPSSSGAPWAPCGSRVRRGSGSCPRCSSPSGSPSGGVVRRPASRPERVQEAVLLAIPLALWAAAMRSRGDPQLVALRRVHDQRASHAPRSRGLRGADASAPPGMDPESARPARGAGADLRGEPGVPGARADPGGRERGLVPATDVRPTRTPAGTSPAGGSSGPSAMPSPGTAITRPRGTRPPTISVWPGRSTPPARAAASTATDRERP